MEKTRAEQNLIESKRNISHHYLQILEDEIRTEITFEELERELREIIDISYKKINGYPVYRKGEEISVTLLSTKFSFPIEKSFYQLASEIFDFQSNKLSLLEKLGYWASCSIMDTTNVFSMIESSKLIKLDSLKLILEQVEKLNCTPYVILSEYKVNKKIDKIAYIDIRLHYLKV